MPPDAGPVDQSESGPGARRRLLSLSRRSAGLSCDAPPERGRSPGSRSDVLWPPRIPARRSRRQSPVDREVPIAREMRQDWRLDEMLTGVCHCGAARWEFDREPEGATACNCTVCRRYGVLWIYGNEGVDVRVSGTTGSYARGTAIDFHFCPVCGCVVFYRAKKLDADGRQKIAVNVRLSDPAAVA